MTGTDTLPKKNPGASRRVKDWYSPAQAVRYSPGATKWLLRNYHEFLSRGQWPPKYAEGCEVRSGVPHAPHEEASAIAGELWLRLKAQGRAGYALYMLYALNWSPATVAKIMGWAEYGLRCETAKALKAIRSPPQGDRLP